MKKQCMALLLALTCLTGASGCAALVAGAVAGGGTYAYVSGWGEQDYAADLSEAYKATLSACSALDLTVDEQTENLSDASVTAHEQDGTSVWIQLKASNTNITTIRVRVGLLGDKDATRRVHKAIRNAL